MRTHATLIVFLLLVYRWQGATATVQSPPLVPDGDNQAILQPFVDSLPSGTTIVIPNGTWPFHSTLNLKTGQTIAGSGMSTTILKGVGQFDGPVIGAGGQGRWANSTGMPEANNCTLRDMTVIQESDNSANNKCIWFEQADYPIIRNVKVSGSKYEGILVSRRGGVVEDCEADSCGNGGPAYTPSTAGINVTSVGAIVRRNKTKNCGQGVECGSTNQEVYENEIEQPGTGSPLLGINVGSNVSGVHNVKIHHNRVRGYAQGITTGNGVGRLSKVLIEHNYVENGSIQFMGGKPENNVHIHEEGPDTFGSAIRGNTIRVTASDIWPIGYTCGPSDPNGVFGREPLTIEYNTIICKYVGPPSGPFISFGGKITSACVERWNLVIDSDTASSQGDIASMSFQESVAVPGFPTLSRPGGTSILKIDGSSRNVVVAIESAP